MVKTGALPLATQMFKGMQRNKEISWHAEQVSCSSGHVSFTIIDMLQFSLEAQESVSSWRGDLRRQRRRTAGMQHIVPLPRRSTFLPHSFHPA